MKKVLLLRSKKTSKNSPQFQDFATKIQQALPETAVDSSSLDRLLFDMSDASSDITDVDTGKSLTSYDLVIIHVLAYSFDEAHAVAAFCRAKNIRCLDNYPAAVTGNKLVMSVCFATNNIPTPRTLYGPTEKLAELLPTLGKKAIFKDNNGTKGRLNFLISTKDEILKISQDNPETHFVLQSYIENTGDLRIVTMASSPILAFGRHAATGTHLNNTSQGATADLVPLSDLSPDLKEFSVRAARSVGIDIAGVDAMLDVAGNPTIIEVNHTPQMATGAFLPEKIAAYASAIQTLLE